MTQIEEKTTVFSSRIGCNFKLFAICYVMNCLFLPVLEKLLFRCLMVQGNHQKISYRNFQVIEIWIFNQSI